MMSRNLLLVFALALIIALPFLLRPKDSLLAGADETLVIITPNNEAIRYEFARGFRDWYRARTGHTARIDWRTPGGTSDIARYLASEYEAPFESMWRRQLKLPWSDVVQHSFDYPRVELGDDPDKDSIAQMARRTFLQSNIGIGIDLFFGGGSFDLATQAAAGRLVDSGFIAAHPELFGSGPTQIPQTLGGEPFWDKGGAWFGTVLSAFGICYNDDAIARLHVANPPANWSDLAQPAYFAQEALADPNQSGSVAKAFEMIIQQQMELARHPAGGDAGPPDDAKALRAGWLAAMQLIEKMGANTRYFADAATKIPIDVGDGDAAVGMAIDFYGRFQSESSRDPNSGKERMHYFNPPGGTSIGVDPIGLLRGAPHRKLALAFMEYVMSVDGQKLWDFKVGVPGGPEKYALRRLPIRRELYAPEYASMRADPNVFPYLEAQHFTYHAAWTAPLFNPIRFIVRVMCVDPHDEARAAWDALIQANHPAEATRIFEDVSAVSYDQAKGRINETLRSADHLAETRLAAELTEKFRAQYRKAGELAREGR
jgi:ABC-type Fe3+ transport system substrate-binding protein